MSPTILIADDHDVIRQGVRALLSGRPDWKVVGEASNAKQALAAVGTHMPDLIILDVTMPGGSGLEATPRMLQVHPGLRILIFTMHESRRLAQEVRDAGAHGYVQKSQAARDLIVAVERLLAGETFFGSYGTSENRTEKRDPKPNRGLRFSFALA